MGAMAAVSPNLLQPKPPVFYHNAVSWSRAQALPVSRPVSSIPLTTRRSRVRFPTLLRCSSSSSSSDPNDGPFVEELCVPLQWTSPHAASQESEWLKNALQEWLDNEYCPEPANIDISQRCARVYYYCLLEKQLDLGDILMQMVRDLETFSFKESFHGAFSSANAAIDLITKKIRSSTAQGNT